MRSKPFDTISQSWLRYQDYVPLWTRDTDASQRRRRKGFTIVGLSLLIIILIPFVLLSLRGPSSEEGTSTIVHSGKWTKPPGLTIVALVFYGRRANVQILERYLRVRTP